MLKRIDPQDPVAVRIRELQQAYPPTASKRKTPQEWLTEVEAFIQQQGHFPRYSNPQEKALYAGANGVIHSLDEQNPVAVRMRELREQYSQPSKKKTPQEWLTALENFIEQNGRFPSSSVAKQEESRIYTNANRMLFRLDPQDPVAVRIRQLRREYPPESNFRNTPQECLNKLEIFVQKYGRFPSTMRGKKENKLAEDVQYFLTHLEPQDLVASRIRKLQQAYGEDTAEDKSPKEILALLEAFVQENEYFPTPSYLDSKEYRLYLEVHKTLTHLDVQDPVAIRIRQLHQKYSR